MHCRAYQETSVIVELFTRSFGRVNAVAKGAKRPKSPLRSILTPASKLSISLSGKNELKNLTSIAFENDIFGAPTFVINKKLFWGQDRLEYALEEINNN